MRRRQFLIFAVPQGVPSFREGDKSVRIPLRFLTQTEALIVAAAASRIFPNDDVCPGAKEVGVAIFIDRQLAGTLGPRPLPLHPGRFD